MDQITSLAYLLTTAGTVAVVTLITQYVKSLLPAKLPIRVFVLLLCLAIQVTVTILLTGFTTESLLLAIVNSFIAASASMGAYEIAFNPKEKE